MIIDFDRVLEICKENYEIVQVDKEPNFSIIKCGNMCLYSNIESMVYYVNVYRTNIILHNIDSGNELEFKTIQEFQFWASK